MKKKTKWSKKCHSCDNIITYRDKYTFEIGMKKITECKNCKNKIYPDLVEYKRKCKVCEEYMIYKYKKSYYRAIRNDKCCSSCSHIESMKLEKRRMAVVTSNKKRVGSKRTDETKHLMSKSAKGNKNKLGWKTPSKTKKKLRVSTINYIENAKGKCVPRYNINSIKIIDEYGKQHGYNFQHAENGGEYHIKELGYWVDGYDKEKNVVIEYYEKAHKRQTEKDKIRKQEIVDLLGCKFIELKEWGLNRTRGHAFSVKQMELLGEVIKQFDMNGWRVMNKKSIKKMMENENWKKSKFKKGHEYYGK